VVRIEFDPDQTFPALFSKTQLSAADWPPRWLKRLFSESFETISDKISAVRIEFENLSRSVQQGFDRLIG
jgi:hypothetical protein